MYPIIATEKEILKKVSFSCKKHNDIVYLRSTNINGLVAQLVRAHAW